jgi:hypothetical protein
LAANDRKIHENTSSKDRHSATYFRIYFPIGHRGMAGCQQALVVTEVTRQA